MSDAAAARAGTHLLDQAARFNRWGRPDAAARVYRLACASPLDTAGHYSALVGLARSLDAAGENKEAMTACRAAVGMCPEEAPAYGLLALLLLRDGQLEQAANAASDAWQRDDGSAAMPCLAASIALRRGRIGQALTAVSAALDRDPANQRARALRAIAQGSRDGQTGWPDLARLVRIGSPPAPDGFPSLQAFNRTLAEAVCAHDMLESDQSGGPLVEGARLHDIFALPPALVEILRAMFLSEARLYAADHSPKGAPARLAVRGWATVMEVGAYERPHIHDGGWLSAVYYPQLPEPGSTGGELVFGPHDLGLTVPSQAPFRVSPSAGRMIVFPSWVYHSTVPFAGWGVRISIAADILRGL